MKKIIAAILLVGASLGAQTLLRSYAVVNLPSAASQNGNTLFVNNGSSATDCTVGGGLYLVPCRSNGSAWSVQSTSGSSAWSALTSGTNTTGAFLIGTGASLGPTGTGTIKATGVLASAGPTPTADGTGCTLNLNFGLLSIAVAAGGSNYLSAPLVNIQGTGVGAAATALVQDYPLVLV